MTDVVFVSPRPQAPIWGLGPLRPERGDVVLLGWTGGGSAADAGVPPSIALLLARALCAVWRLSFRLASADAKRLLSKGLVEQAPEQTGWGLAGRLARRDQAFVSTVDPAGAMGFLSDPGWSLGGQVAVLTDRKTPAPVLAAHDFAALTSDDWLDRLSSLSDAEVEGVLRPGVDGDVAALFMVDTNACQLFLGALRAHAEAADVTIREVREDELRRCLATAV